MYRSGIHLRLGRFADPNRRLEGAGGSDQRALSAASHRLPASVRRLTRDSGRPVGPSTDQPEKYGGLKSLPWASFVLGLLWYAVVWWAVG